MIKNVFNPIKCWLKIPCWLDLIISHTKGVFWLMVSFVVPKYSRDKYIKVPHHQHHHLRHPLMTPITDNDPKLYGRWWNCPTPAGCNHQRDASACCAVTIKLLLPDEVKRERELKRTTSCGVCGNGVSWWPPASLHYSNNVLKFFNKIAVINTWRGEGASAR